MLIIILQHDCIKDIFAQSLKNMNDKGTWALVQVRCTGSKSNYHPDIMRRILLIVLTITLNVLYCDAQWKNNNELLLQIPEFYKSHLAVTDTLFQKDLAVLEGLVHLDTNAIGLFRPPVLYDILKTEVDKGYPPNYLTLKNYLEEFVKTPAYLDFVNGIRLYKKFEHLYVADNLWEEASQLFVQLGFTKADLDDFCLFLKNHEANHWTYKQAYSNYLQEMEKYQ